MYEETVICKLATLMLLLLLVEDKSSFSVLSLLIDQCYMGNMPFKVLNSRDINGLVVFIGFLEV